MLHLEWLKILCRLITLYMRVSELAEIVNAVLKGHMVHDQRKLKFILRKPNVRFIHCMRTAPR